MPDSSMSEFDDDACQQLERRDHATERGPSLV